jgi:hypothetical protein
VQSKSDWRVVSPVLAPGTEIKIAAGKSEMVSADVRASDQERVRADDGARSGEASGPSSESLDELVMNKLERLAAELRALGIVF